MEPISATIFSIIILLFSVVIHEVAHGSVALYLGDQTAKAAGRLTLNPISHIDPFGSIIVPLLLALLNGPVFGWAKPVPINPYNLRYHKWGELLVALAGPVSNLAIAVIFGLAIRFIDLPSGLLQLFSVIVLLNLVLAIFNLIPIPPLDGSHILLTLLPARWQNISESFSRYGLVLLLVIIFFGLRIVSVLVFYLFGLLTGLPLL